MSSPIQIFAVEDDPIHQENLKITLDELGYDLLGLEERAEGVLPKIQQFRPDIVLLDIQLAGEKDGIQLAEELNQGADFPIIYTTSFQDQATYDRARITRPHAYLIKPVNRISLQSSIESAFQQINAREAQAPGSWATDIYFRSCFFTKIGNKLVKILPEEVQWITVSGNHYCEVVTDKRKANVRASLTDIQRQLEAFPFVRVHRSYLVNAHFIESINEQDQTLLVAGNEIPVGVSYREGLMSFVRKL